MKQMNVLITGGGGFIGSAMLVRPVSGFHFFVVDHGKHFQQLRKSIHDHVEFFKGDADDEKILKKLLPQTDIVLHLAGGGGNNACLSDPYMAIRNNIITTRNLVKWSIEYGIEKFIYSSTISAYGTFKRRKMPLMETMKCRPDDFYGAIKYCAERSIVDKLDNYIIFRLSNVYGFGSGYGKQWGGLIGKFILSLFNNEVITVYGSGEQKIDFVHVNDVVNILYKALNEVSISGEIINVGGGLPISVLDIANHVNNIGKLYGRNTEICKCPPPNNKIWPDRWLSITKAKEIFNWKPSISMQTGIESLITEYDRMTL